MLSAARVFVKKAADVNDEDVKCILKDDNEQNAKPKKKKHSEAMSTDPDFCDAGGDADGGN